MEQQNIHVSWWWELISNIDNELTMFVVTIWGLILATLWLWYKFKFSNSSNGHEPPLPPGPCSLPIVGYLPFLSPDLHTQFTNMARTYGPIFKLKLGSKLYVVINTPELAKEVVHDQDVTFSNRDQHVAGFLASNGGQDVAFSANNPNWRKLRKILVHEVLNSKNLEASSYFRRDEVRKTVKNVFGKINTRVDFREIAFSTLANVLTRTIWGNTLNNNLVAEVDVVASNVIQLLGRMNLSDFFPSLAPFDLQGIARDMKKQRNKLDRIITNIIEDRIKASFKNSQDEVEHGGKRDLLDVLLNYKDKDDSTSLSMTQIKALLIDILIAGTESTASTIEWAMSHIMKNHNIMKRIQEELEENVGLNNTVEESDLPQLQYLAATIKEALRMYPIAPFLIPRTPSKSCMVGGYMIPKGCTIFVNVKLIHRDPRHWNNPLEFNPTRFLTNKLDYKGKNLIYFPFGSGQRLCPGVSFAEKMSMLILASLLHSYEWSLPKDIEHDFTETFGISLKKRKPVIAIPSPRLPDMKLYM